MNAGSPASLWVVSAVPFAAAIVTGLVLNLRKAPPPPDGVDEYGDPIWNDPGAHPDFHTDDLRFSYRHPETGIEIAGEDMPHELLPKTETYVVNRSPHPVAVFTWQQWRRLELLARKWAAEQAVDAAVERRRLAGCRRAARRVTLRLAIARSLVVFALVLGLAITALAMVTS